MSYPRIASRVFSSMWALRPMELASLLNVLQSRMAGERAAPETLHALREGASDRFRLTHYTGGKENIYAIAEGDANGGSKLVAAADTVLIFGSGILGKHLSAMEEDCAGGLSVDRLQAALQTAAADPAIKNIILHLDTPGGVATGMEETALLIEQISQTKNVVAYVDSLCASAGMWIIAACDYIYVTPSADVGSIGVYSALFDLSAHYAKEGVKVELFKDGAYKAAGYPGTSLTDEQRAKILEDVMECSGTFKASVKKYRPHVSAETMQGQCFTGAKAVEAGLADHVVHSLADVLSDLAALKHLG
jgi:signal peptide peptidase SppA